jgi:DNA-binding NtrC family response regulator
VSGTGTSRSGCAGFSTAICGIVLIPARIPTARVIDLKQGWSFSVTRVTAPQAFRSTGNVSNGAPAAPGHATSGSVAGDLSTASARLVDTSRVMRHVRTIASRAAAGDAKVFITGESGVGKDVVAQYIHAHSARAARPFIAVNCAAITESLLETELFGHARGSFTGAYRDRAGRLEAAHRGTIFLDEIGEMSLQMQAHLLRFLESGEIQPVGSAQGPVRVDVRVICATNRDISQLVATGAFRSDLLYRVKVVHIHVPPLRERKEDLPALISASAARTGKEIRFTDAALQALTLYRWPGNVRELQNVIEQAAWMSDDGEVDVGDLPETVRFASTEGLMPRRERRRRLADDLYSTLVDGHYTFWGHIHPLLLKRDITRHDVRQLVGLGLAATRGNYRALLKLFGMAATDYKRFMNFLAAHDCVVDFRQFRGPSSTDAPLTALRLPFQNPPPSSRRS